MTKTPNTPFSCLDASSTAQKLGYLDLGFGRSCAIWTNQNDYVRYDALEGNTFSYYVHGGHDVWRVDQAPVEGWPGAMCIFPHGHSSEWKLSGELLQMVHLYLPEGELRRMFSEWSDRDGRLLDLADATFLPAGELAKPFVQLARAMQAEDAIAAQAAMIDMVSAVISQDHLTQRKLSHLKGGLSPIVRRRVVEYIEAELANALLLKDLAALANLSEFHFQRSFKESFGVSPNIYIAHRRVTMARELIGAGEPLAQVALVCGYSSQSHLTRSFKAGIGVTPSAYRKAVA